MGLAPEKASRIIQGLPIAPADPWILLLICFHKIIRQTVSWDQSLLTVKINTITG